MREILFKAKRVDNVEWIYGDIGHRKSRLCDIHTIGICDQYGNYIQVEIETVCQFTGLYDKNGKKIFEGDILRFPAKDEYEKTTFVGYEVFYHDNDCADKHIGFQMDRMRFYGHLCGGECRAKLLPKYTSQMVIIGNIHDNPELLENK